MSVVTINSCWIHVNLNSSRSKRIAPDIIPIEKENLENVVKTTLGKFETHTWRNF